MKAIAVHAIERGIGKGRVERIDPGDELDLSREEFDRLKKTGAVREPQEDKAARRAAERVEGASRRVSKKAAGPDDGDKKGGGSDDDSTKD